jgi:hypothetical protein
MRSIIAKLLLLAFFAAVVVVAPSTNVPSHAQLNGREKVADPTVSDEAGPV